MGIFDKFRKRETAIALSQLISEPYRLKYPSEYKFIWGNYVPKNGQSDVLQGELLRQVEKLRYEAQNNGNINWGDDFRFFCRFLQQTLCRQLKGMKPEQQKIALILKHLESCGDYAARFRDGEISNEEFDISKMAYVEDNLYDMLADMVAIVQIKHKKPIPYEKNLSIAH